MPAKKKEFKFKDPFDPTPAEIKAYYAKAKREFSMKDMREFEGEPDKLSFKELMAELREFVRQEEEKQGRFK